MKNILKKVNLTINKQRFMAIMIAMLTLMIQVTYAGGFASSKLATGTIKLVNDITTWLMILAPIAVVLVIIFFAIKRAYSDEMEQKQYNKKIVIALVSGVICVVASSLVALLTSYYV